MLEVGALIGGEYRVVRLLGRGGMGEVYEALHERMQRRVAVKTIRAEIALDPASLLRFRREAETAASLGHPNIVQVTDWKEPPGESPFLVMEHLDGRSLAELIEDERKMAPGRVAFIGMQLLSGLAAAHRAGIVHRDVKPGNVFVLSTFAVRDLVKIVDFGIAKMVVDVAATSRRALTDFGQILGTFAYMAPEQAIGAEVDARADIFAAGATLFHALSGVRPTEAIVPGQTRVRLVEMAPWVDKRLAAIIDKAMERIPDRRFATAEEMGDALKPFAEEEPSPGSMTMPDGPELKAFRDRFAAETKGVDASTAGGTAVMAPMQQRTSANPPPQRVSANPPPYSAPTPPLPPVSVPIPAPISSPVMTQRRPQSSNVALYVVGGVLAIAAFAIIGSMLAMRMVVAGATSPASTEQRLVDAMKRKPCVAPTTCVKQREGSVSYPVCTKNAPMGPIITGDFVLVKKDARAYAGYITQPSPDGEHFVVKSFVGNEADDVTPANLSRLCK